MHKRIKTEDKSMNIREVLKTIYIKLLCIMYPIRKQVMFTSFNGQQYSDNPRAISEKLHELYPDYRIVWYLKGYIDKYEIIPDYVYIVSNRFEYFKEFYRSFAIISNCEYHIPLNYKRKGQCYVQTWHGDRPFKKILLDVVSNDVLKMTDGEVVDIAIAESRYGELLYNSAFGYNGEILKCGSPRNDSLFNEFFDTDVIKERLGIENTVKVLLFAPTFRDNKKTQDVFVDIEKVLNILQSKGETWLCLCRAHIGSSFNALDGKGILDVSDYPDMADLLAITDLLISDYSTCACDITLVHKPVIMTVFDEMDYKGNCREMYVTPKEVGFIVAYTQEELEKIIRETTRQEYLESCNKVNEYFGVYEEYGSASKVICKKINDLYEKNNTM